MGPLSCGKVISQLYDAKDEERIEITGIDEIYKYADRIQDRVKKYLG
ncbi:MAG: hypothetical protein JST40_02765 [Armatimonadetes bacterium]|nr:hypothetical protein [Armatimonadota bacterium]